MLKAPQLEDELNKSRIRHHSSASNKSDTSGSSGEEDLLEEFKRETEKDVQMQKEREETRA